MRPLNSAVCVAAFAVFAATIATPASARIVCNAEGDCWHTDKVYHYKPDVKVVVHPDS